LHTNHGYIADTSDPYECFFITFQHRNITCLLGDWLHVHNPIFAHVAQDKIYPLFEEIMQHAEQQHPCWDAQVSALIYLLLMHFYSEVCGEWERETLEPDWVATTRQWIEQNLEHDITVGMLAEQAHISMYHFIREFKKYFHLSPLEYIILRRVNRAKYLLMKSDQSIYQIGRDAGFPSHSSMIRNFKRIEGNTPSGFRTSIQGNQRSR
jgi:AraC-like DNA-binding protein